MGKQNEHMSKSNNVVSAVVEGSNDGRRKGFDPDFQREKAEKRMVRLITKASMIAAGIEPPSGQWETRESAVAWLDHQESELNGEQPFADAAE